MQWMRDNPQQGSSKSNAGAPRKIASGWVLRGRGFTLIELIVVMAVIGLVTAIVLPAIQSAREAGRRLSCANNLKNIGLASLHYESIRHQYANQTESVSNQPTWIVSILPFMEESTLYTSWARTVGYPTQLQTNIDVDALRKIIATPVAAFYCPSRRPVAGYPIGNGTIDQPAPLTARTDYALNGGCSSQPDDLNSKWPGIWNPLALGNASRPVRAKDVTDGLSKTYLVGEKSLNSDDYTTGAGMGDVGSIYECALGTCVRFAKRLPSQDPQHANSTDSCFSCHDFGSVHSTVWNAVFCDGAVHAIPYTIDFANHAALASRNGGDAAKVPD
jgi:prepilin-type N-terminal cleavage/methylation domain-containing protein